MTNSKEQNKLTETIPTEGQTSLAKTLKLLP